MGLIENFEHKKELQKELWKVGHTVFWSINSVILFTIAADVILLTRNWLEFVISKLVLLLFYFFSYNFFKNKYNSPNFLIHLVFFGFNFLNLIAISEANGLNKFIYTTILITAFISFNSIIIWKVINSFFQYILVIIVFAILVNFEMITNPNQILLEGGYLFLLLGFLSLFFPRVKEVVLKNQIKLQVKTKEKIDGLNKELVNTNTKYTFLKEKVLKKDNESKFIFQQISNNLDEFSKVINSRNNLDAENSDKLIALIENLRNQSSVYFKPVHINTEGSQNFATDIIDLRSIYQATFNILQKQIQEKELQLTEVIAEKNTLILGNEKVLKTIIFNILNFMIIFSKKEDEIDIHLSNLNNDIIFCITNKTNGLNNLEIESYFRDIEYVNYNYKKHSDSVKIGLRISKQLTQKMNGYFSYVSSEKRGFEMKLKFKTYNQ